MKTERVVGTILLALVVVFGVALSFIPLGTTWSDGDETRTTEIYGMFTKVRETTAAGEEATGTGGATWYYVDPGLDGTGGITLLRAMGFVLGGAVLLALAGLLMTALPRVNRTRAGAAFALPAVLLFAAVPILAYFGTLWHADHLVQSGVAVEVDLTATVIVALGIIAGIIATGLGFVRRQGQGSQQWLAGRRLRCPQCETVVATGYGVVPICPTCSFGADYEGPAGKPVAAQPVNA